MKEPLRGERACRRLEDGTAVYLVGQRDLSIRLDLFLKERIPKLSRQRIQEAIATRVKVAGRGRPRPSTLLHPGDTVIVEPAAPPIEAEARDTIPFLHLDADLLVIDKPAGLLAHPSNHVRKASVTHLLAERIKGPVHLVHRLDRETSGLMVIARHAEAARSLSAQMARESAGAEKIYKAIVWGAVGVSAGVIDLPIGRAVRSAVYVKRGVNHAEGRGSRTEFTVERRGEGFSLLALRLRTGRRHQIRVHLAAIGHAVVGDKLYGPAESHYLRFISKGFDDLMRAELLAERHLLHAAALEFRHPSGGRPMRFTAPLPPDMAGFLARAGLGEPAC